LRGSILNMASVLAWSPSPTHFATHAYAASKAAIIGFSRAMAAHYAPDRIRINVIAPALVRTPMSQRAQEDEQILEFMKTKQPLVGDLVDAEQVARAALFLLSDDSAGDHRRRSHRRWRMVRQRRPGLMNAPNLPTPPPCRSASIWAARASRDRRTPRWHRDSPGIPQARSTSPFPMAFAAPSSPPWRPRGRLGRPRPRTSVCPRPGLAAPDGRSIAFMPGRFEGLVHSTGPDTSDRPEVPVLNDAQAALLGEVWQGAARGAPTSSSSPSAPGWAGRPWSTADLLRGPPVKAGHLGHVSLNPDGNTRHHPRPGSLEDAIGNHNVSVRTGGRFATTHELIAPQPEGDAFASEVWLRSVSALAAAIASFTNVLDPEIVILGGGIAAAAMPCSSPSRMGRPLRMAGLQPSSPPRPRPTRGPRRGLRRRRPECASPVLIQSPPRGSAPLPSQPRAHPLHRPPPRPMSPDRPPTPTSTPAAEILDAVAGQLPLIRQAADWFAATILAGRMVHLFGSGHSRILVEEMWPRYGSFPGFNPIVELSLSFHNLVVGANGQRQAMFLENVSGLAERILRNFDLAPCGLRPGDLLERLQRRAGGNGRGLPTPRREGGRHHLAGDTPTPAPASAPTARSSRTSPTSPSTPARRSGDAMVTVPGLDTPVAPGSTVGGCMLVNCLKAEIAARLTPPASRPRC
jgi:hypothetical protein